MFEDPDLLRKVVEARRADFFREAKQDRLAVLEPGEKGGRAVFKTVFALVGTVVTKFRAAAKVCDWLMAGKQASAPAGPSIAPENQPPAPAASSH